MRTIFSDSVCFRFVVTVTLIARLICESAASAEVRLPQLRTEGGVTQLLVEGKPFLIRGGELRNSTASSLNYLGQVWGKLERMRLNTLLAPAYWELIEPEEGRFDFKTVDGLIQQARQHHMRIVLLWFGSWKNGASSYVPAWIKLDQARFPRVVRSDGTGAEILSAVSASNLQADAKAFSALMDHVRAIDEKQHTVIMVQVENEIGLKPEPRDHSPAADAAFSAAVPQDLMSYLRAHQKELAPEVEASWRAHGSKRESNWQDTFGRSPQTDELFNAWVEAHYTGVVAAAGKAKYPLPMYVNAALIRDGFTPGQYPSGGPLPHLFDIWHAAAPSIDLMAPDIYFPSFPEWAAKYSRPGNTLFIPEVGGVSAAETAANALFAFGELHAIGFSPFGIETYSDDRAAAISRCYDILEQLTPLILSNRGTDRLRGLRPVIHYDGTADMGPQSFHLGGYRFTASFPSAGTFIDRASASDPVLAHGALIVQLASDEFIVAGTGVSLSVASDDPHDPQAHALTIQDGQFVNGLWKPDRYLNGDETDHGAHVNLPMHDFGILRVRLYHYH